MKGYENNSTRALDRQDGPHESEVEEEMSAKDKKWGTE
jgi:hypothetical protein